MSFVNFLLLSNQTEEKDIPVLPGANMKMRVYVGQLGDQINPKATDRPY